MGKIEPRMISSGALVVKIMSDENTTSDTDPRKCFQVISSVIDAKFRRTPQGKAFVAVMFMNGEMEDFNVDGTCYLMNEAGDTLTKFCGDRLAA